MTKIRIVKNIASAKVSKKWAEATDYIKSLRTNIWFTLSDSFLDFVELMKTDEQFKKDVEKGYRIVVPPYGFGFTKERLREVLTGNFCPDSRLSKFIEYVVKNGDRYFNDEIVKDHINWRMFYRWGYRKGRNLEATFGEFLDDQKAKLESIYETGMISPYSKDEDLLGFNQCNVFISPTKSDSYEKLLRSVTVKVFRNIVLNRSYRFLVSSTSEVSLKWLIYVAGTDISTLFEQREKSYSMFKESLGVYGYGNLPESEWMNDFFFFFNNVYSQELTRLDLIIDELANLDVVISPVDFLSILFVFTDSHCFVSNGYGVDISVLIAKGIRVCGLDFVKVLTDVVGSPHGYVLSVKEWSDLIDDGGITTAGTHGVEVVFNMFLAPLSSERKYSYEVNTFRHKYAGVYGDTEIYGKKLAVTADVSRV